MINLDLKNIEVIPSSSGGGSEYDDTQVKTDINNLKATKADKTEIPNVANKIEATNIKAGNNITIATSGNNVTINSTATGGASPSSNTGIRVLTYKFSRAHDGLPLFIADDYSDLKAGDLYIVKIEFEDTQYPSSTNQNYFFPNIKFDFAEFNFDAPQQGSGYNKSYLCWLDCEGGSNEKLNLGSVSDTDYYPTNAAFRPLLYVK